MRKNTINHGRNLIFAVLILGVLIFTGCSKNTDWIMFRGSQGRGYSNESIRPPVGIKWKIRLQDEAAAGGKETFAFNNPVIKGDTIYFGATDGNFYALDIDSGYMRWIFKTEAAINSVPYADEENVYFGSNDGKIYAVSQDHGDQLWSYDTGRTVQSTVVKHEDTVMATSDGGAVFFLSPAGELQYKLPNPVWHYDTFQVFEDVMYFAPGPEDNPHSMGAFDLNVREYLWILDTYSLNAIWYSFPALYRDRVLMSTATILGDYLRFNYYAFNRLSGDMIWRREEISVWGTERPLNLREYFYDQLKLLDYLAPAVWRDKVIYTSGDSVVRCFNTSDGSLAWEKFFSAPTSSPPTVAGDRVYFGLQSEHRFSMPPIGGEESDAAVPSLPGDKPRLICLSAKDGSTMWELEIDGALLSAPVIADNRIVFGTDADYFYILEELLEW